MTNKDEASPRQRQIMEKRWDAAHRDCAYERCNPAYAFHAKGCPRREQKIQVTNLNTGVVGEATIVHGEFRAVKEVLDQHDKQAVRLKPLAEAMDVPQEALDAAEPGSGHYAHLLPQELTFPDETYWDAFEKGEPGAREIKLSPFEALKQAPARPWWKFWGRRG